MSFSKSLIKNVYGAYKNNGFSFLCKEAIRYFLKPRFLREDLIWFFIILRAKGGKPKTTVHGQTIYLNPQDRGLSKELSIYHFHEPLATKVFKQFLNKGMNIVDLGSNIGYYVLLESPHINPGGKIIAIEPEPINFNLLKLNIKENNLQNVVPIQAAIGDYDGKSKFYLSEFGNLHSLFGSKKNQKVIETKIYKLDTLVDNLNIPVDLVRMDIEGGEVLAIKGMHKILTKYKPILVIELHSGHIGKNKIYNLLRYLQKMGYEIEYFVDKAYDFSWTKKGIIQKMSFKELFNEGKILNEKPFFTLFLK